MDEEYVETVLELIERVPAGRVTTYGTLASMVQRGGPRQAGRVLALHSDGVPWWRVVHADGRPATCHGGSAVHHLRDEGTPMTPSGRVDLASAGWAPPVADRAGMVGQVGRPGGRAGVTSSPAAR